MKKFFTFMIAAIFVAFCAQSAKIEVVSVDPQSGSTLPELSTVRVEFSVDDDNYELELLGSEASMRVVREGETKAYTYGNARMIGSVVVWTLEKELTEPGNYVVTIDEGCVEATDYSTWEYVDNETITLTYTISAGDSDKALKILNTYPAAGDVEELSYITIQFGVPADYEEIELLTARSMTVTKDGAPFTTGKGEAIGNNVTWELAQPATESGVYVVTIDAEVIESWAEDPQSPTDFVTNGTIELIYNIVGESAPEADVVFDPAPGVVESLDIISMKGGEKSPYAQLNTEITYNVTKNGADFTTATAEYDGVTCTLTLETPATETGTYEVTIPAKAVSAFDAGWDTVYTNNSAITLKYVIEGAPTVVYDLEITKTNPKADLNVDDIQFESFILTTSQAAVKVPAGKTIKFASANTDYEYEVELAVKTQMGSNIIAFIKSNEIPLYNGAYTLTVPEGTFGDEEWYNNPNTGHSNPEIVLDFTLSGLRVFGVTTDLMPTEFAPEATVLTLDVVTMTMPGIAKMAEGAKAHLSCVETRYDETVEIVEGENGVFTMTFPKADEYGVYTLVIAKETFFNAQYVETEGKLGATNDTISHQWTVGSVGVESVDAEENNAEIFTLTGLKAGKDVIDLAPGIYVRNGKKIVIR